MTLRNRNFGKECWHGPLIRVSAFPLLYDSRDYSTNAYQGYYLRIDQRFSPAFLGNKYAFSSTELTTSYYHPYGGGVLAGQFHTLLNLVAILRGDLMAPSEVLTQCVVIMKGVIVINVRWMHR